MRSSKAIAHTNIALIKYWGKRYRANPELNLPAVGSISMTLDELRSETSISESSEDRFELNGSVFGSPEKTSSKTDSKVSQKVFAHLDLLWQQRGENAGRRPRCLVQSTNYLPTAAGLASSASGFAALTLAGAASFELPLFQQADAREQLSVLARRGSGSAARSIWGGFVRLDAGTQDDGSDCRAYPLAGPEHWDLKLLVVHTAKGPKEEGSTGGMVRCQETSPYFDAWQQGSIPDMDAAETALKARSLEDLGPLVEHNCFKMHACMLASNPPLMYWNGCTLEVFRELWRARKDGMAGYATSDAGPHVKVFCLPEVANELAQRLGQVSGVVKVDVLSAGPNASVFLSHNGPGSAVGQNLLSDEL